MFYVVLRCEYTVSVVCVQIYTYCSYYIQSVYSYCQRVLFSMCSEPCDHMRVETLVSYVAIVWRVETLVSYVAIMWRVDTLFSYVTII